jgi:hypothetical protein
MQDMPALVPLGDNPTLLWGMRNDERLRRIGVAQGFAGSDAADGPAILANMAFAFDPVWTAHLKTRPGTVMTRAGVPVLAHVRTRGSSTRRCASAKSRLPNGSSPPRSPRSSGRAMSARTRASPTC